MRCQKCNAPLVLDVLLCDECESHVIAAKAAANEVDYLIFKQNYFEQRQASMETDDNLEQS